MKGNEARVVFFLHPVDQLKDGQVSKVQPLRRSFAVSVLLLLGLLLGLGVRIFVLLQCRVQTRSQQEPVSAFSDATTESPERSTVPFPEPEVPDTERIGESEPEQIDQSRRNDSTMAIEQPTEIIRPGITYDSLSQTQMKQLSSKNTPHQIYNILQCPENWRDLLHGCSTPWLHHQVSCWPILPSSS